MPRPEPSRTEGRGDARPALPFVAASDLRARTPAEPDWLLEGYLARHSLTLLAGKPKAGKSTLSLALGAALASDAAHFLGRKIASGPVLYVSEESAPTLAHKLAPLDGLRVLPRDAVWPKPSWRDLIAASVEEAQRIDAPLLIVDTWSFWTSLPKDAEKDAGAVQAAMQPLLDATRAVAVMATLHQRKAGGEDGDSVRGSSAIAGSADIVIELERLPDPTQRLLLALSRYPSTPGSLLIDRDPATGAWRALSEGGRTDGRALRDRQALISALDGELLKRDELEEATGAPSRQWDGQLKALVNEGLVRRTGDGKKGDPYRFTLAGDSAQASPAQKERTNPLQGASVSAAHPFRDAAETSAVDASDEGARRATSADPSPFDDWTDEELEACAAEQAAREDQATLGVPSNQPTCAIFGPVDE